MDISLRSFISHSHNDPNPEVTFPELRESAGTPLASSASSTKTKNWLPILATHSAVRLFIEHLSALDCGGQKEIAPLDAFLKTALVAYDQVQGKGVLNPPANSQGRIRPHRSAGDDQQVHIAIGASIPVRSRAEEDNLPRSEPLHDLPHNTPDSRHRDRLLSSVAAIVC
jgi:hypothetical protein